MCWTKEAFEGARAGYQAAQKTRQIYTRMYQMGLLENPITLAPRFQLSGKGSSYESADTALRLAAMETYNWGVHWAWRP